MEQRSLLLGCGNDRRKKVGRAGDSNWRGDLTTLDIDPNCGADIIWDLEQRPLPFDDETFDEIAAYDVLEHQGRQGDWRGWFDEMAEYHRILKPGGEFCVIVPVGKAALSDPGHTRLFHEHYFWFLQQDFYARNLAEGLTISDYRWYWKLNFDPVMTEQQGDHHLVVVLRK